MTVSSDTPASWRVLAIYGKSADANAVPQVNVAHSPGPGLRYEVLNLECPTLASIQTSINDFKPNILYIWAGAGAAADPTTAPLQSIMLEGQDELLPEDIPELVAGHGIHGLVLNMVSEGIPTAEIRQHVPFLIRWSPVHEVTALNAATFAHMLFSLLAMTWVTFAEAFALGNHVLRAYACADTGAKRDPFFPILDSTEPPELPGSKPHPAPQLEGVDLSLGFSRSVPGWEDTRLLAPVAECSLLLTSAACILDTERLAALGLALRSLCCLEVRRTRVREVHAMNYSPQHIVSGTSVAAVVAETVSGAAFPLVLGVPQQVLGNQGLLEAALQATLTCDAISLRFQLPPHGSTPPQATANPAIAHSTKCIPALITTSVWVVNLLRSLASSPQNRLLSLLGIGMVGNQPVAGFSLESAKLFSLLQMQQPVLGHIPQITYSRFNQASGPPSALWDMNADVPFVKPERGKGKGGGSGAAVRETKFDELTANAAPVEQWASNRPPLPQCTPQTFMNDLINFLTARFGWTIHPGEFPNSVLNGNPLDLCNLYRAVVDRGGFKMGNAINWKGEVFTKMANWTADHKMTGVGNALKRHYRKLLWEYERANQRDIAGDKCSLCHGGTESGTDWVACGMCQRWQHINCDPRSNLGSLADYAEGGKPFSCPDCSTLQAKREPSNNNNNSTVGGASATSLTGGAGGPVATHMPQQHMGGQMGGPGAGGPPSQMGGFAGGMHSAQPQQSMQGVGAGGAGVGGAQQMAPQNLQPMQPIQQQVSFEQFMGRNPNTMPVDALPVSVQQQQAQVQQQHVQQPQQPQHFQQQQPYGAQHAQMAAQQQMQHMQGQQQQFQPPR